MDSDGNEEANIQQMVTVILDSGTETGIPAEPRSVTVSSVAGGKIEVEFLYDPYYEENGPGIAEEARIYWDDGTGTMDWSSPHATVSLGGPTEADRYTWESAALTDGTEYQFTVRIASDVHPAGIETENTDTHVATPDSDVPATPALEAEVI
ncbi:MAG: hypothetical protein ACLFWL_12635 [Candidatus Brocadiia bacterium]